MHKKVAFYLWTMLILLSLLFSILGCSTYGAELLPKKIKAGRHVSKKDSLDYIFEVSLNHFRPIGYKALGASVCLIDGIPNNDLGAIVLGLYLSGDAIFDLVELIKDGGDKSIMESSATICVEGLYKLYEKTKNIFKK